MIQRSGAAVWIAELLNIIFVIVIAYGDPVCLRMITLCGTRMRSQHIWNYCSYFLLDNSVVHKVQVLNDRSIVFSWQPYDILQPGSSRFLCKGYSAQDGVLGLLLLDQG